MSIIATIEQQYFDVEKRFSSFEFHAIADGNELSENDWRYKRELNTHAYFLFLFTRLEHHIRIESEKLINHKIAALADWKDRSIWEISNDDISLKKRLCLLTEKGNRDYNRIVEYYDIRNKIGHGETINDILKEINMPLAFEDFKRFFLKLRADIVLS